MQTRNLFNIFFLLKLFINVEVAKSYTRFLIILNKYLYTGYFIHNNNNYNSLYS